MCEIATKDLQIINYKLLPFQETKKSPGIIERKSNKFVICVIVAWFLAVIAATHGYIFLMITNIIHVKVFLLVIDG